MEFSTEEDYNLTVENHIKQLVETHNQAMSNNRQYHEKMKLTFDKKKVGRRLVTNFILWIMCEYMLEGITRQRARVGLNR